MFNFSDAHCHIYEPQSETSGIAHRIINAVTESDWENLIKIQSDSVFVCLGIHPWHINTARKSWDKNLYNILKQNPKIMIGETGLDASKPNIGPQEEFFIRHLEIAHNLKRAIHIHCVKAWDRLLHILKNNRENLPPAILIHGFSGTSEIIHELATKYNVYFSYSAPQTNPNITRHRNRILATPRTKILLESDANTIQTATTKLTTACENIAKILDISPNEVINITNTNFQKVISQ